MKFFSILYPIQLKTKKLLLVIIQRYINDAKSFFRNIVRSLDSIIEEKEYLIMKNLCQIVKIAGYECSNPSKKDIKNMVVGFKNTLSQLDQLKQNPEKFYQSGNASKLASLCEKFRNFYASNYQVLNNFAGCKNNLGLKCKL